MQIFVKLAWRNLFRNKRRTFIAGTAIGIGLAALIYTDALMIGMENNMIVSATASYLGEGQIHRQGFRDTYEVEATIENLDSTLARLGAEPIVQHFTERTMALGMISSPANVNMVSMIGIQPETERFMSQIDEAIIEGAYIGDPDSREILIGSKLAELLEVSLGDRVVLTVAEAVTGELSQEMFRISGIYHFNVDEMDRGMAFVGLAKSQKMLNLENQAHEIAIKFTDTKYGRDAQDPFWARFSDDGNEAVGWVILLPQLKAAFDMSQFSIFLIGLILFSVVALGIINTLFMSLYERMFEFGVMRAVGTHPFGIARLILLEAGALALVSIVFGAILAFIVTSISAHYGIDYTGIEFAGVTFRELIYPRLTTTQFMIYPFWVFVFTILVGFYPATYAARMSAAKAMRESF